MINIKEQRVWAESLLINCSTLFINIFLTAGEFMYNKETLELIASSDFLQVVTDDLCACPNFSNSAEDTA